MKKFFIICISTAVFCLSGFVLAGAQGTEAGKFEYGFKGGLSLNKMPDNKTGTSLFYEEFIDTATGEHTFDWVGRDDKALLGLNFGAIVVYHVNNNIAVQSELLYTTKGVEVEHSGTTVDSIYNIVLSETDKIKLSYLEIPVLVKYKIPAGASFSPSIYFGGTVAFKLSAKYEADYEFDVYENTDSLVYQETLNGEPDIDNIKSTDFSLVFGGDVAVKLGNHKLLFDLRYTMGMTELLEDVAEDDIPSVSGEFPANYPVINSLNGKAPSMKNRSLAFSVGLLF